MRSCVGWRSPVRAASAMASASPLEHRALAQGPASRRLWSNGAIIAFTLSGSKPSANLCGMYAPRHAVADFPSMLTGKHDGV